MKSDTFKTLDPNTLSQPDLHGYLLTAVAPRPICFASTIDPVGNVNLSPFSFFNVFSSNPPIMIFSPARSGRDNSMKHTHQNIKEIPEVVINIVNYPIVEQMSLASTTYDKGVNEFIKAGFTQVKSEKIRPPRVKESPVAFECVVEKIIELGNHPGAGNLIIAKVVLIHLNTKYLNDKGELDTKKLDLVARMGESWYCRAIESALFEIPKPIQVQGMGVDQLPKSISDSTILTGNNLGRLGNLERLPSGEEVFKLKKDPILAKLLEAHPTKSARLKNKLHQLAKDHIEQGEVEKALAILLFWEVL